MLEAGDLVADEDVRAQCALLEEHCPCNIFCNQKPWHALPRGVAVTSMALQIAIDENGIAMNKNQCKSKTFCTNERVTIHNYSHQHTPRPEEKCIRTCEIANI